MILGTSKLKPVDPMKMVSIGVKDIIMHPKFWGRTFTTSDIALLQLHDPAVFSKYVQPICLPEPTYRLKVGTQCWVTGWGQVKQRFSGEQDGMEVGGGARVGAWWGRDAVPFFHGASLEAGGCYLCPLVLSVLGPLTSGSHRCAGHGHLTPAWP